MQELPNHIIDTLLRKLQGISTQSDDTVIADWISNNPSDQDKIDQFLETWRQTDEWAEEKVFDTANAWSKISDRVILERKDIDSASGKPFRVRSLLKLIAAAAILTGVIFSGWRLYNNNSKFNNITAATDQHLTLSDGTKVWLRKGATIKFPRDFKNKTRKLQLSGEAFFDVTTLASQPFLIETPKGLITVLGTSFLVNAGPNEERVAVLTGKILFADRMHPQNQCTLLAHEEALFSGQIFDKKTFISSPLQWQQEELNFSGIQLKEVIRTLAIYYNVPVKIDSIQNPGIGEININASFKKETINQAIEELTKLTDLHYQQKQDTIIIY
jgi:ferric-dicitrate binding protein FerR (iron transport regulator)